jgi:serine carboxypeptidase-like clade 2
MVLYIFFSIKVGNPLLDWNMNFKGAVDYYWSHGLMSDEVFDNITRHCNFDNSDGVVCNGAVNAVDPGQIDAYNIYAPICLDAANGTYYPSGYVRQRFIMFHFIYLVLLKWPLFYTSIYNIFHILQLPGYDPCSYYYTYSYLNDPAVQNAFHARMTSWSGCA